MRPKWLIVVALIAAATIFVVWANKRMTEQDTGLEMCVSGSGPVSIPDDLRQRELVWCTNANVPLKIEWGGEGYDLFQLIGVPESVRPFSWSVGRRPIRDEWNVASVGIGSGAGVGHDRYWTEDLGGFINPRVSADWSFIVSTRQVGGSQDVVRITTRDGGMQVVSFHHSIDRWPSISRDGRKVLFHSFRDVNPAGDLYLAVQREFPDGEWETHRLTDNATQEYILPMMDSDASHCIAVERKIGDEVGRIILWSIVDWKLENPLYLTADPGQVKHPSLSANAEKCCWQEMVKGKWSVIVWDASTQARNVIGPSVPPYAGYGWVQPAISPDGRFVTFVDDLKEAGADRIGIYDLRDGSVIYLQGCGGNIMFPSLTDKLEYAS